MAGRGRGRIGVCVLYVRLLIQLARGSSRISGFPRLLWSALQTLSLCLRVCFFGWAGEGLGVLIVEVALQVTQTTGAIVPIVVLIVVVAHYGVGGSVRMCSMIGSRIVGGSGGVGGWLGGRRAQDILCVTRLVKSVSRSGGEWRNGGGAVSVDSRGWRARRVLCRHCERGV